MRQSLTRTDAPQAVVTTTPTIHRANMTRDAQSRLKKYDWMGALAQCEEVLAMDPLHLGALEVQAQALWFGARFPEVVTVTTRLLRLNPGEPGYRYTRGMAHLSMGNLSGARRDFEDAIAQSQDEQFRQQVREALEALHEGPVALNSTTYTLIN